MLCASVFVWMSVWMSQRHFPIAKYPDMDLRVKQRDAMW